MTMIEYAEPETTIAVMRRVELEREDARRVAINEAIRRLEMLEGNPVYLQAWKAAIRALRGLALTKC